MLLLHAGVGSLLLRPTRSVSIERAQRTELRLVAERRRPPPVAPAVRAPLAAQRQTPGTNAITLPALPAIAISTETAVPSNPPAPGASAPAPLDLRLLTRIGIAPPPSLADQIRADGRANSPRETMEKRLASSLGAAMGNGETEVIEGVQGGRMIRGPNGDCTLIRPSMMQEVDPGNERWRQMPSKASDCSKLQPGARRHQRPP